MYLEFYGLKKLPFHITPNPEFLFPSPSHREALASIIYAVKERKGFLAITGEVGVGKTTILRSYLEDAGSEKIQVVYLFNPVLPFKALLKFLCGELNIPFDTDEEFELVNHLNYALIDLYAQGTTLVLIIDEAQNMPIETLEKLRMLSNLETSEDKLLQVILMGQPEFDSILDLQQLRQFKQRIAVRTTIMPLSKQESLEYIQFRLKKAGCGNSTLFTKGALNRIAEEARGIPRVINILCDNALITGFGYQKKPVTEGIVREVIRDFHGLPRPRRRNLRAAIAVGAALALMGAALVFSWDHLLGWVKDHSSAVPVSTPRQEASPPAAPSLPQSRSKVEGKILPPEKPMKEATVHPDSEQPPAPASAGTGRPKGKGESAAPVSTTPTPKADSESAAPVSTTTIPPQGEAPDTVNTEQAEALPDTPPPLKIVVKHGDHITALIQEIYGRVDRQILTKVRESNPHISNLSRIKPGDQLSFPNPPSRDGQSKLDR